MRTNTRETFRRDMRDDIYEHLLHFGIIYLRNHLEAMPADAARTESAKCVAQLLHYIPPLMMNTSYGPADAYFLEIGARDFLRRYPLRSDGHFLQTADLLLELYENVIEHQAVGWTFPNDVEVEVRKVKKASKQSG